jgi:hypothetical protein
MFAFFTDICPILFCRDAHCSKVCKVLAWNPVLFPSSKEGCLEEAWEYVSAAAVVFLLDDVENGTWTNEEETPLVLPDTIEARVALSDSVGTEILRYPIIPGEFKANMMCVRGRTF